MSLDALTRGGFSVGVELPLDNDWSASGQRKRVQEGRPFGIPDLSGHEDLIILADQLGFRAAWIRDVPLYDPSFADAAQVFETMTYLGYLSALTRTILLGTAAVVLPLRQPWLVKKAARTVQTLSHNRLLLGIASGDRPLEYPIFDVDYATRGERFRRSVEILRADDGEALPQGVQLLPQAPNPPLLVAGLAQQTPEWVGKHMDGWLAYPGTPNEHVRRVALWRKLAGDKPYISFIHLDLLADRHAPVERIHFGIRTGVQGLITELNAMRQAGVNHIGLHFRHNQRPLAETFHDIAESVLPHFHQPTL